MLTPSPTSTSLKLHPNDKWKAVSHLQKCIRRGWSHRIEPITKALWDVDNAYLRYRLAVIAVEDVGIANLDKVHSLLEDKINKRWVVAHGGIDGLVATMQELAEGVKDRTACSWGSNASRSALENLTGEPWAALSPTRAADMAWDTTLPHEVRAAAVFRAAGTDLFPHHDFPVMAGDWASWVDACTTRAGGMNATIETMVRSQKAMKEWHPAFLPLCHQARVDAPRPDTLSPPKDWGDAGMFCGASIDGHTAEGKRAITALWRSCPELRKGWVDLGWSGTDSEAIALLSKMVFLLEGGAVDKRLGYATAHEAETMQKTRWAKRAAMEGKPAATVVWRHMEQLTALRKREVEPALSSNIGMGW